MIITPREYSTVRLGVKSDSSYRTIESWIICGHPYRKLCILTFSKKKPRILYDLYRTLTLSLSLSHTHTLSHAHTHTPSPLLFLSCCLSLTHTHTHTQKCLFIRLLKNGNMGKCPHKSTSPCNTCVIPLSLYKFVSS